MGVDGLLPYVAGALACLAACGVDDRMVSVETPGLGASSQGPGGAPTAVALNPSAAGGAAEPAGSAPISPEPLRPGAEVALPPTGSGMAGGTGSAQSASPAQPTGPIPLNMILSRLEPGGTGFVLHGNEGPFIAKNGGSEGGRVGAAVAGGGDVNGDGLPDLLIGAPFYGNLNDAKIPGAAFVVFSQRAQAHVDLNQIPERVPGLLIRGNAAIGEVGIHLANAGDVNGDGLDDVLVGGVRLDTGAAAYQWPGVAMVVFGSATARAVDLGKILGASGEGFLIEGDGLSGVASSNSADLRPLAAAGDLNGDGLGDVLVGAPGRESGRAYVIFGKASFSRVALSDLDQGTGGYGYAPPDGGLTALGISVAALGDINGDGVADFAFGAPSRSRDVNLLSFGGAYVAWGAARAGTNVEIGPGTGFSIDGVQSNDRVGNSVVAAGDVNSDGIGDLLVNAPLSARPANAIGGGGGAYVVFGKRDSTAVNLATVESGSGGGFMITRSIGSSIPTSSSVLADSLAPIGDIDGDGRADALVSDPGRNVVYVLFGKADGGRVEAGASTQMRALMEVPDAEYSDVFGGSTAFVGDVNGDGEGDYLIGAPGTRIDGWYQSGAAYLVYGPGVSR